MWITHFFRDYTRQSAACFPLWCHNQRHIVCITHRYDNKAPEKTVGLLLSIVWSLALGNQCESCALDVHEKITPHPFKSFTMRLLFSLPFPTPMKWIKNICHTQMLFGYSYSWHYDYPVIRQRPWLNLWTAPQFTKEARGIPVALSVNWGTD